MKGALYNFPPLILNEFSGRGCINVGGQYWNIWGGGGKRILKRLHDIRCCYILGSAGLAKLKTKERQAAADLAVQ